MGIVVSASNDCSFIFWNTNSMKQLLKTKKHENPIQTFVFVDDYKKLVTASNTELKVWNVGLKDGAPKKSKKTSKAPSKAPSMAPSKAQSVQGEKTPTKAPSKKTLQASQKPSKTAMSFEGATQMQSQQQLSVNGDNASQNQTPQKSKKESPEKPKESEVICKLLKD